MDSYLTNLAETPIFYNDIWIVPCNLRSINHWVLFVVLIGKKQIFILDSLHATRPGKELMEDLRVCILEHT